MDSTGCNKVQSVMRKVKKKQVKDELDRQKQAEKKKRRLEKALATSAAIISELEKKKLKKKEEQERLDEEGAAIAEAVALHVLIGEEDSSDETVPWDYRRSIDVYVGQNSPAVCSIESIGWVTNGFRSGRNEWSFSSRRDFRGPSSYLEGAAAAELIAAQAVKSLQIADEDTIVINDMMRQ